jgi:hypothetical protein
LPGAIQAAHEFGDSNIELDGDGGNGDLLLAQSATLSTQTTVSALSFYVNTAAGNLVLGIYDATGPGGGPGTLLGSTANWKPFAGAGALPGPHDGYFVMSKGTWTGNLGDLSGADAICLTDLTTNTGWRGYAEALADGKLVSGNVHAWLCSSADLTCNNLTATTTYYFADANSVGNGGASFTTIAGGDGPNAPAADWSLPSYFGSPYVYWTGQRNGYTENTSPPSWGTGVDTSYNGGDPDCHGWSVGTSGGGNPGQAGGDNSGTGADRPLGEYGGWWGGNAAPSYNACVTNNHLICYVNP